MGGRGAAYILRGDQKEGDWSKNGIGSKVKDTLPEALGKKGLPISMTNAYKDANPNYDGREDGFLEYSENCQRCAVAYELRRRGYDVTALPSYEQDTKNEVKYTRTNGADYDTWTEAFRHARPKSLKSDNSKELYDKIIKNMRKYGNGSRAVLSFTYSNRLGGHVINVENRKGKIYFVDAQSGERLRGRQYADIIDPSRATIIRTDNLQIDQSARHYVTSDDAFKRKNRR